MRNGMHIHIYILYTYIYIGQALAVTESDGCVKQPHLCVGFGWKN